ncbi:MAG: hypothetical protein ABFC63_02165 [Thermoguttaceae bacterium]
MAALLIMVMFAFLFLPMVTDMLGLRDRGPVDEVVAMTTAFGNLKRSDVQRLRNRHNRLVGVTVKLFETAGMPSPQAMSQCQQIFGPSTDDAIVQAWLLARYAQKQGIVVSDDSINEFLKAVTGGQVSSRDMLVVFQQAQLSAGQFFDLVREGILPIRLQQFMRSANSPETATPAQRWDYFNRVKRFATIEAVAVPVANSMKEVAKPTDEQLKAFFEEHKNRIAMPDSPEPGFNQPQRIGLEYVTADVETFAKAITDQQIKDEYEKNKEAYDALTKKVQAEAAANRPETKPAAQPEKAPAAQPPKKTVEPAKNSPAKETKAPAKSSAKPSTTPSQKPVEPKKTSQNGLPSSSAVAATPFQMAAFAGAPKDQKKPDAKATPAVTSAKSVAPTKPAAETKKPEPPKTGLTDELKARIRRYLATMAIDKLFDELKERISEYGSGPYADYVLQKTEAKEGAKIELPPEPKFEEFAKKHGLTAGKTGLMALWDLQTTDIGVSYVPASRNYLWQYAFRPSPLFRCETAIGQKGDKRTLFWKNEEREQHIPKFAEARAEVLRQWQLIHARDIARKTAEKLAAEARKANKSLKQAFVERSEYHVILPGKFTWLTFPNIASGWQQPARLSAVDGIPMAGWDFMQEVFRLELGQVGVAFNAPKTVAYVIRPSEFTPSYVALRLMFEKEPYSMYFMAAEKDINDLRRAWFDEVKKSVGFAWGPGRDTTVRAAEQQSLPIGDE